ncbi:glycosyltransferase family 2 protein [Liquorilactobacillus uvarum]|uniref:Glycosyltransferase n=1 Tax=Liquorilactobacillus uvarum DSM 19971 TaxID=1423812 RepID=A0A0R1PVB0_9LACO|nr:glycosyltransferase family 2 protein [Liquorilactobacillus uvarum]KRL36454.1 glycosyltransferase [Liquorilactobacillus uvarum DSM 19971]
MKKLTIVIPAFNEEKILPNSIRRLLKIEERLINNQKPDYMADILIVDDGSSDKTWKIIESEHRKHTTIKGIKLSRNFGHQNALIAGLKEAINTADVVVTIDADLQDDPTAILKMFSRFIAGVEIVYGVRNNRETDTWFKRNSALFFYKLLNFIGVKLIPNHADFRLMSKRVIKVFLQYQERNIFIRGIIPMLGFRTTKVYYKRTPRLAGKSKYPLTKMLSFAWNGITSFSIMPVRFILVLGVFASSLGIIMFCYSIITKWLGLTTHGWSSLMVSIWVLGGLQMVSLGIIGEYIGKITTEVKHRPRYIIQMHLD